MVTELKKYKNIEVGEIYSRTLINLVNNEKYNEIFLCLVIKQRPRLEAKKDLYWAIFLDKNMNKKVIYLDQTLLGTSVEKTLTKIS